MSYKLDDLVKLKGFDMPDYIKIDVERTEDKLFKGGHEFFRNEKIKSIMVEISERNFTFINNFL